MSFAEHTIPVKQALQKLIQPWKCMHISCLIKASYNSATEPYVYRVKTGLKWSAGRGENTIKAKAYRKQCSSKLLSEQ